MQFVRKIMESEKLLEVMDLPQELRHSIVEVIVLPVENQSKNKQPTSLKRPPKIRNDIIDRLQANPLKIDNFMPLSREQIYER